MAPTEAPVPRALAATGHRGAIYRDPYGLALIIGPSNGPLTLHEPGKDQPRQDL
jgi:aldehyde dehydrogenase (NAD+)